MMSCHCFIVSVATIPGTVGIVSLADKQCYLEYRCNAYINPKSIEGSQYMTKATVRDLNILHDSLSREKTQLSLYYDHCYLH